MPGQIAGRGSAPKERLVMKQMLRSIITVIAVLAAAGCATDSSSRWGFRYEDRDKILEAATKIESAAVSLQEMAMRPEAHITTKGMYMAGTYDATAADSIRLFAAESGRFVRAVRAWQPDGSIGLEHNGLVKQWNEMQIKAARLVSSEKMRVKLESINAMMFDLGRFIGPIGIEPGKVGAKPAAAATR